MLYRMGDVFAPLTSWMTLTVRRSLLKSILPCPRSVLSGYWIKWQFNAAIRYGYGWIMDLNSLRRSLRRGLTLTKFRLILPNPVVQLRMLILSASTGLTVKKF